MRLHDCSFVSPGLSTDAEVDELIKKTCYDADVFVYVCNGTATLEEPVIMQIIHIIMYAAFSVYLLALHPIVWYSTLL